jgi:hypothetical protein
MPAPEGTSGEFHSTLIVHTAADLFSVMRHDALLMAQRAFNHLLALKVGE